MLPTQGQGASQAIEDAEALGAFFEGVVEPPSPENLAKILEVRTVFKAPRKREIDLQVQEIFQARYSRASRIQAFSRQAAKPAAVKGDKTVSMYRIRT